MAKAINHTFTLIFKHGISENPHTIKIEGPEGIDIKNPGPHPFVWDRNSEQQTMLDELRKDDSNISSAAIKELGQSLHNAVFKPPIAIAYGKAQASIGHNQGMRIKLRLEAEATELLSIPWEAMHDGTEVLTAKTEYPLIRTLFISGTQFPKRLEVHGPLRILYVESWPKNLRNLSSDNAEQLKEFLEDRLDDKVDFKILKDKIVFNRSEKPQVGHVTEDKFWAEWEDLLRERRGERVDFRTLKNLLEERLGETIDVQILKKSVNLDESGKLELEYVKKETFWAELRQNDYHVIYFSGHGHPSKGIYLADLDGNKQPVSAIDLAQNLKEKSVRLVFLNACHTGAERSKEGIAPSFARTLATEAGLPAVIGMQYKISEGQARPLEQAFFESLANSYSAEQAIAEARKALIINGEVSRDFISPVMYLMAEDGRLFKRATNWASWAKIGFLVAFIAILAFSVLAIMQRATQIKSQSLALATSAQNALSQNNNELAVALALEATKFENPPQQVFDTLDEVAHAPGTIRYLQGHTAGISEIDLSQDGRTAISASGDHTLILWDVESGAMLNRLEGHEQSVWSVAISPNGDKAFSGGKDGWLIIWDLETGSVTHKFNINPKGMPFMNSVTSVDISADGKRGLSGSYSGDMILWDMETGNQILNMPSPRDTTTKPDVVHAIFTPDGNAALASYSRGDLLLWDLTSVVRPIKHLVPSQNSNENDEYNIHPWAVAVSSDGMTALSGYADGSMILWNLETGQEIYQARVGENINDIAFGPDGKTALLGMANNALVVWDIEKHQEAWRSEVYTGTVSSVAFHPSGQIALSGSDDSIVRVVDIIGERSVKRYNLQAERGGVHWIRALAMHPTENYLLVGATNKNAYLFDIGNSDIIQELTAEPLPSSVLGSWEEGWVHDEEGPSWARSTDISSDGSEAVIGYDDGSVILWDLKSFREIRRFKWGVVHSIAVGSVAFSPDDSLILSGAEVAALWNKETGEDLHHFSASLRRILSVDFSPDGNAVLTGAEDGYVRLYKIENGEPAFAQTLFFEGHKGAVNCVAFSPDGKTALSGSTDNTLILWKVKNGKIIRSFEGHTASVLSVAWSADGTTAYSGSDDYSIIVWDVKTGQKKQTLQGHTAPVFDVVVDHSNQILFSGSGDGSIRAWLLMESPDSLIEWTHTHRYVRELTCAERKLYQIKPLCTNESK